MNSILKNKKFENTKNLFILCYDDSQEACVLEAIENCNEGFKWSEGDSPTTFKSKGIFVHEHFNYGKCAKFNRYIICIDLKTKQLTYILDNENLDSLRRLNNLLQRDYLNYLAIEFLDYIKVKPILDDKEKEYLSAVIRPFKDRVIYVKKSKYCEKEFISIKVRTFDDINDIKDTENICLPCFIKDSMYKNMKNLTEYTLEQLELK